MAAPNTNIPNLTLSEESQQLILKHYHAVQDTQKTIRSARRARFKEIDRQYQREKDQTQENKRAKAANKAGDVNRHQNITVPVVMPQVEAAVTYQSSVFLTGNPIFGVVSTPEYIDEAKQLDSLFENHASEGGWTRELILFFRDGAKYNFAPLEVTWTKEVTSSIETNVSVSTTEGVPKEVIWEGNKIRRLDPYNTFVDPKVLPTEVHKFGEYAGFTEVKSRIAMKQFIAALPDKIVANVVPALESKISEKAGTGNSEGSWYHTPEINDSIDPSEYERNREFDWDAWMGLPSSTDKKIINYSGSYELTTLYVRALPSDYKLRLPRSNTPQVFKIHIVNHKHIIYFERQTNAHDLIPLFIGQPLEDGLGYQTKSLAENGVPFQELSTTYMASIIASRRRAISDRVLYDPSRIASNVINSANPSAKMPVKPSAFGSKLSDAVFAFPYREDQSASSMQQIQALLGMANQLSGQNMAGQGQFVKGNKTLKEFDTVMQNANGRDQLASLLIEHQVFTPVKKVLKLNVLQFQGPTTVYNRSDKKVVEINPVTLRNAVLHFKVSDGLIPASKLINSESFATAMQVIGSSPQISGAYNLPQLFSYIMKTQGAEIEDFEKSPEQLAYEQAMGSWQSLWQLAIEKGLDPAKLDLGPRPDPKDFNYNPTNNKPSPEEENSNRQNQPEGVLPQ